MRIKFERSSMEIEKQFNEIKSKINRLILQDNIKIPSDDDFQKLDHEFENVKKIYERQDDNLNLLHVEHNYLWHKSFQFLENNPTETFRLLIKAITKLLERHKLRPYALETFDKMFGPYEVALIKISEKSDKVEFYRIEQDIIDLIKTYLPSIEIESKNFENVVNIIINFLVKNIYDKKVQELKIDYSNLKESDLLVKNVKNIIDVLEKIKVKNSYIPSMCYGIIYKLRKKQLHCLIKFMYFEVDEKKKENAQKFIDEIIDEMKNYSKISLIHADKFIKSLPLEKQNDENIKLMKTLKEIDIFTSDYYKEAYSKKDILNAWIIMDKLKRFLVIKAFKENVPLKESLLKYFSEEWSLLYIFTKLCLLQEEVEKRSLSLGQEWEKDVFDKVSKTLEDVKGFFKYEMTSKKDYSLRIMTSSFSGNFSEYFIHELCREFFEYGLIDKRTPSEFKNFLENVKLARNKEDIILNDSLEKNSPDIDIHIRRKCAIFLKNSKIESDEIKKIWEEIHLCNKNNINKIFYCINFIKNIEKIEYIRISFRKIKEYYKDIEIDVFDIKDLVSVLIEELERSGKSKLNFANMDLYRVLDY